jgi:ketosteroid isomerase-like protein
MQERSNAMNPEQSEQAVLRRANDWAAAEGRGDAVFLEDALTDDFVGIGPRGFMLNRVQWAGRYTSGNLTTTSLQWDEVAVRMYGGAAVVIGRQTAEGEFQGRELRNRFRTTLVLVEQEGRWRLASLHLSPIAEMA